MIELRQTLVFVESLYLFYRCFYDTQTKQNKISYAYCPKNILKGFILKYHSETLHRVKIHEC